MYIFTMLKVSRYARSPVLDYFKLSVAKASGGTGTDTVAAADDAVADRFGVGVAVAADEAACFFFRAQSFRWLL